MHYKNTFLDILICLYYFKCKYCNCINKYTLFFLLFVKIQTDLKRHTKLAALLRTDPRIDKFLNISIPTTEFFLLQLHNIDNAACSWRAMLSGISLNVFQGFAREQQLVDYVVNQAYNDNVSVFASKITFFLNINF